MTQPPGDPGQAQPYPDFSGQPGYQGHPGYQAPQGYPGAPVPPGYPYAPGYPAYPAYPPARDTNIWAILALISAFTIPPLAVIAGHVALSQIKKTGDQGRGLAIAGLVIGYVFMAFIVVMTALMIWLDSTEPARDYNRDYTYSMSVNART
jgi:hypothetical protein